MNAENSLQKKNMNKKKHAQKRIMYVRNSGVLAGSIHHYVNQDFAIERYCIQLYMCQMVRLLVIAEPLCAL